MKASSQQMNHAYRVLTLCPHSHHVMIVSRVSPVGWDHVGKPVEKSNRKTRAIRIRVLHQLSAERPLVRVTSQVLAISWSIFSLREVVTLV